MNNVFCFSHFAKPHVFGLQEEIGEARGNPGRYRQTGELPTHRAGELKPRVLEVYVTGTNYPVTRIIIINKSYIS